MPTDGSSPREYVKKQREFSTEKIPVCSLEHMEAMEVLFIGDESRPNVAQTWLQDVLPHCSPPHGDQS